MWSWNVSLIAKWKQCTRIVVGLLISSKIPRPVRYFWEPFARYTSQRNRAMKRLNRTLMEMTHAMLSQAGIPDKFWREAVCTAVSSRNTTTTNSTKGRTWMEILTRQVPYVDYLRCFGCEVWSFTLKRKKLKSKARIYTLLRSLPYRHYCVWDINWGRVYPVSHFKQRDRVIPRLNGCMKKIAR